MSTELIRTPVHVQRQPVTLLTEQGHKKSGGWFVFAKPDEQAPTGELKKSQRILWCTYCADWRVFTKRTEGDRYGCSCCWAHTDDFYIKTANKLWYEDIPLEVLRKIDIPRPNGRR